MKKLTLVATGFLCLGLLGACSSQRMENTSKQIAKSGTSQQAGKEVVDFSLQGVDGKTYRLSDYKGKKVYLKFWASWCSTCLSTLADSNELAKEEAGKDYVVLSVVAPSHNGEKSAEDFKSWYQSLDYKDLPVLMDTEGDLLKEYGIRSYPLALFIASDGSLVKTQIGYTSKEDILQILEDIQ